MMFFQVTKNGCDFIIYFKVVMILTRTTESLAAIASISAHETVCGHVASTALLISSITSNPLIELRLGTAVFSPLKEGVSSSMIEASQP